MYYNRRYLRLLLLPVLLGLALMIPSNQAAAQSGPCLEVAPDSISFYRNICGDGSDWDGLDSHYVMISNCGDTTLVWSITPSEPWIICQPNTGQNFDSVLFFIDPTNIPPVPEPVPGDTVMLGAYLTVEAPGADNSPQ
ncbi:MAG: hypothetical protein KAT85_02555, partial [candidate division Zixibacteria bacterium]|nr:hypothetical protein [candidate division Zixibacteria bacterium]